MKTPTNAKTSRRERILAPPFSRFLLTFVAALLLALALDHILPRPPDLAVDAREDLPFYSTPFGDGHSPFYPAELSTPDGKLVNWRAVPGALSCGECHRKETLEWAASMHAISDLDLIYESTVQENTNATRASRAHGVEKGRWCEACHNPLGTLTGAVTPANSVQEIAALEEGTACVVCHTVNRAEPLAGNGALEVDINGIFRYNHPALIAAAPSRHARDMRARREQPLMGSSALCGACHTEIRPTSVNSATPPLNLQDTYDEWRHSPWAKADVQCQDCHMAANPGNFVAALKRGERPRKTVSHRIAGNNYLLADTSLGSLLHALRGGSPPGLNRLYDRATFNRELDKTHANIVALLREAAELKVDALPDAPVDGALHLRVAITNVGAGHALPTGPLDQRYLWLEVEARDIRGNVIFHQGAFDAKNGEEDPQAVRWIKEVRDMAGRPERRHLLFDAFTLHYTRKPIPPGQSDTLAYRIPLPPDTQGAVTVDVRLWYRLAVQDILENIPRQGLGNVDGIIIPPLLMEEASYTALPRAQSATAPRMPERPARDDDASAHDGTARAAAAAAEQEKS
ncbi:MAG: cytochrome c family protein [Azoarcus sp.]|jgi:mono/diheme cytochrome c family protein|nr:cytochrome c family protein [Azoarcus sp.]